MNGTPTQIARLEARKALLKTKFYRGDGSGAYLPGGKYFNPVNLNYYDALIDRRTVFFTAMCVYLAACRADNWVTGSTLAALEKCRRSYLEYRHLWVIDALDALFVRSGE